MQKRLLLLKKHGAVCLYDQKLTYCVRPEEYVNKNSAVWKEINAHLDTKAANLQELIEQLGVKKFGHKVVVGDCFCGGGSVPFEAARMGCDVFASDLNPIAGLLTWSALNIAGASDEKIAELRGFQQKVYDAVDKQISNWGIEINENGDRANSARFKTARDWAGRNISGDGFAGTLLRNVFMALYLAIKDDGNASAGKNWLKNEVIDYWNKRELICEFLGYITTFEHINNMSHWGKEAQTAMILKELVSNDGV
ncbi:MAG: hypothetical protein AAB110_01070 [Candidatus Desantisbacteria bacterium]